MGNGDDDLVGEIKSVTHAGIAKALSWKIQSSEEAQVKWEADNEEAQVKWEADNEDLMMELLRIKTKTCPEFREALLDSDQHILAEATHDLHWGTGISPYFTSVTKPNTGLEKMFFVLWRWTHIQNHIMGNLWMNRICLQTQPVVLQ